MFSDTLSLDKVTQRCYVQKLASQVLSLSTGDLERSSNIENHPLAVL